MKKKILIITASVLSVVIVASVVLCLAFCGKKAETIVLKNYEHPFYINTELQSDYLAVMFNTSYTPDETDEVNGRKELSRPLPVTLEWEGQRDNYVVEISESADMQSPWVFTASENKIDIYNLKIATEYYWQVKTADNSVKSAIGKFSVSGEDAIRNLYIDGVTNARDIGGWEIPGGRVKQGLLFRGARLNQSYATGKESSYTEPDVVIPEITASGAEYFKKYLGIKTEIDLRLDARNGYPQGTVLESVVEGVNYVAIPMNGNASTGTNGEQFKVLMECLADKNNYPVYIHCNIGTDRTGMVCYIINALLGVSEEDLLKDYLFSNFGNIGELKKLGNSKNAFIGLNDYSGETLQKRAESYFESIGVSRETYTAVRNILTGKDDEN